ncbi:hypothetical protein LCGC14_2769590 [marine sediment metagenome]|uniref:DUF7222 domain-containing protein n=1 Tax=marine sediment metagenome TaxID=412755 RepID=A0A0F9BN36_9ZZZZ
MSTALMKLSTLQEKVIEQLGYSTDDYQDETSAEHEECISTMKDILSYGIDDGYGKFIYHSDTVPFFNDNKSGIMAMAKEQSEDFGTGMIEMIKGFNCFKDLDENDILMGLYEGGEYETNVKNGMAWYAGEEVCRQLLPDY